MKAALVDPRGSQFSHRKAAQLQLLRMLHITLLVHSPKSFSQAGRETANSENAKGQMSTHKKAPTDKSQTSTNSGRVSGKVLSAQ